MTDVLTDKEYVAAIDLGSSTVITVVALKDPSGRLDIVDVSEVPSAGIERGEIRNVEEVAQTIQKSISQIENRQGVKIEAVYTGISGHFLKCMRYPYYVAVGNRDGEIREEDVAKIREQMYSVQPEDGYEFLERIPQHYIINDKVSEMVTNPVGMFGRKLANSYLFVFADKSIVSRVDRALSKVNIAKTESFINSLAVSDAVLLPDEKSEGVMLLDIGGGTTDVCIWRDNIVRHLAVIPMGGNTINMDIQSFGIPAKHIETLKIKFGEAQSKKASVDMQVKIPGITSNTSYLMPLQNLAVIIEGRLMDIIELAMTELERAGLNSDTLRAGIVITGGVSLTKNIDQFVRDFTKMKMNVRIATPVISIAGEGASLVDKPQFSTAVGLLVKGVNGSRKNGQESEGVHRSSDRSGNGQEKRGEKRGLWGKVRGFFGGLIREVEDSEI